jgi:hypothetical protein
MCLRFQFCTHHRVCILHFLKKSQIRCTLLYSVQYSIMRDSETFRQEIEDTVKPFSVYFLLEGRTHSIDPNTYVRLVIFCRESECRKLEEKTSSGASSTLNTNFPADFYPIVSAAVLHRLIFKLKGTVRPD